MIDFIKLADDIKNLVGKKTITNIAVDTRSSYVLIHFYDGDARMKIVVEPYEIPDAPEKIFPREAEEDVQVQ